jgi:lambda family phage portal protein
MKTDFLLRLGATLDRAIEPVFPGYAKRRVEARLKYNVNQFKLGKARQLLASSGGLAAARDDLERSGRVTKDKSADSAIIPDLERVVARSQERIYNDPIAAGIARKRTNTVIGKGPRPQSRIDPERVGRSVEECRAIRKEQEAWFREWAKTCDASGHQNFFQMVRTMHRQFFGRGECLPIWQRKRRPWAVSDLALMLVEPDRLATPPGRRFDPNIRGGVEIDEWGEPIRYHITAVHPGDNLASRSSGRNEFIEIPARDEFGRKNVLHTFLLERPGQSRGVPGLTPILNRLTDRDDHIIAAIQRQIATARVAWFIETDDLEGLLDGTTTDVLEERVQDSEAVEVHYGNMGEKPQVLNDNFPSSTFQEFHKLVGKDLATGVQMPYESVTADRSDSTYSSDRSAQVESREGYEVEQDEITAPLVEIWCRVMEEGFLLGRWGFDVSPTEFYGDTESWCEHEWIHKGWPWVDPSNEADATETSIRNRLLSLQDYYASKGKYWEDEIEQIEIEMKALKEKGLLVETPPPSDAKTPPPSPLPAQQGGGTEGEGEGEGDEDTGDE